MCSKIFVFFFHKKSTLYAPGRDERVSLTVLLLWFESWYLKRSLSFLSAFRESSVSNRLYVGMVTVRKLFKLKEVLRCLRETFHRENYVCSCGPLIIFQLVIDFEEI